VYVTAAGFFIPEAFTPNADNVNDYFEIIGIELFEQNSITIVNRWGRTVYKARGYGISTSPLFWDGKSNQGGDDSDLPSGSYFYVLDLGNGEKPIAGSVYIDR
jgi:gliding motility-associated-like protein